ncbi:MAG TPA: DUF2185 domain-containing protein [Steroidobacteraceae bacterium]|nr:DUF2185 domain-containing protein [Steroidobacteraceae bacterium]
MTKKFRIPGHGIKDIVRGFGACMASDRITVDGMKVRWMYREAPDHDVDSGWHFFAGDETEEYANDPDNFAIYEVNTIANYDPTITAVLDTQAPCAFEWDESTQRFIPAPPPDPEAEEAKFLAGRH